MVEVAEPLADAEGRIDGRAKASVIQELVAGGFRWQIVSGWKRWLLSANGLDLETWLATGQAQIVKRGTQRTVYRVELPPGVVYIKHNHVPDWTTWLRQLIRPSKARWEFGRALQVAARGVPTAPPIACGAEARWAGGESYLITASLDPAETLNDFLVHRLRALPPRRHARLRQIIAQRLGAFIARLHEAGLGHGDFHVGNILVQWDGAEEIQFVLIDLSAVRLGKPLDYQARLDQLAMFSHWFLLRCGRTDRLRFWLAYCRARPERWRRGEAADPITCRNLAAHVEQHSWDSNRRFWHDRDARCRQANRYYRKVRAPGVVGYAVRDLEEAALAPLLANPDAPFQQPGVKLLKNSPSSTVAELTLKVNGQPRSVIYKRFRVTKRTDPLAALVRTTPALRSWIHGQGFRERGLPTARPLAFLQRRRFGLVREEYLITEKVDDARELNRHIAGLYQGSPADRLRLRGLIEETATLVRGLHERHYSHRDLKAANLLVVESPAPVNAPLPPDFPTLAGFLHLLHPSLVFIDLVGVEKHRRLSRGRKVQNLARLHTSFVLHPMLTRTEKLRFLRAYLQWGLKGSQGWKAWWTAIAQATQAKIIRNQKSGRVLA